MLNYKFSPPTDRLHLLWIMGEFKCIFIYVIDFEFLSLSFVGYYALGQGDLGNFFRFDFYFEFRLC